MANKLTNEVLEKMVMQVLNESDNVNEVLGAIKDFFASKGPTRTPSQMGIARGSARLSPDTNKEIALKALQNARGIPNETKEMMVDLIMSVPSAKQAEAPKAVSTSDLPELPASAVKPLGPQPMGGAKPGSRPVYKTGAKKGLGYYGPESDQSDIPTTKGTGFTRATGKSDIPTTKGTGFTRATGKSDIPTTKGTGFTRATGKVAGEYDPSLEDLPTPVSKAAPGFPKDFKQKAPSLSMPAKKTGMFQPEKRRSGMFEQKELEALVMEALEEMAKKQKPTKETKKEPKKAGKK